MAGRVTLAQVAEATGVSVMTVSNVLNDRPGAAESTRQRVLAVAAELGYAPSAAARSLKGGRTGMIGIVMLDLTTQYALEILRGIADALATAELELLVSASYQDSSREYERVDFLSRGVVDGLILVAPALEPQTLGLLQARGHPYVVIDPRQLEAQIPRIIVDNYEGARDATRHLISLGHRHIAFIAGNPDFESSAARRAGYEDALRLAGLPVQADLIVEAADFLYPTAFHKVGELLKRARPTAVFAGADILAFAATDAVRTAGLRVPEDISVVGFDDLPRAAHSFPGLTTVRQPLYEMGQLAARVVADHVDGESPLLERMQLKTTLVVRESTAAPARS